jgi:putative ABC transport system ATP-binding protein
MTVIVITHNSAIAPIADRVITVKSGKIAGVKKNENPVSIESIEW